MRIPMFAFVVAGLLVAACHGGDRETTSSPNAQQQAGVGVVLRTAQPQYPRGTAPKLDMVLRNNGSTTCELRPRPWARSMSCRSRATPRSWSVTRVMQPTTAESATSSITA